MLTDPVEIEIMSKARQKNVRDPGRSREHFERIFDRFFSSKDLQGQLLLDIGPGQYDFGVLAAQRGAVTESIDSDPAVVELGRHRGYTVVNGRIQDIAPAMFSRPFDGLFCKFSLNAFWFWDNEAKHLEFLERLFSVANSDAWIWIAPWNGVPKTGLDQKLIERTLAVQEDFFDGAGCESIELGPELARYFGVNGSVANNIVYCRHLEFDRP